jgi:CRP-like cAMP-binding protein
MAVPHFRGVDVPLFRGLKQHEIDLILGAAKRRRYSKKSVITHQGELADQFFLLLNGRMRFFFDTTSGRKLVMIWITPGHVFGASALIVPPVPYLASTEAVQDSTALVWDGPTIRSLARQVPQLMVNVFRTNRDYLAWYIATHNALVFQDARERLADILLGYAHSIGQRVSGGMEFSVSNEELAHAANISVYTVSRLISGWHSTGAIRKHRGRIVLRSHKRLL